MGLLLGICTTSYLTTPFPRPTKYDSSFRLKTCVACSGVNISSTCLPASSTCLEIGPSPEIAPVYNESGPTITAFLSISPSGPGTGEFANPLCCPAENGFPALASSVWPLYVYQAPYPTKPEITATENLRKYIDEPAFVDAATVDEAPALEAVFG